MILHTLMLHRILRSNSVLALFLGTLIIFSNQSLANESQTTSNPNTDSEVRFLPAEQAFTPHIEQQGNDVSITFDIAPKYYLYHDIIKVEAKNAEIGSIEIPQGTPHNDEYMGETHIFTDKVTISLKVNETQYFPQLTVTYQGCTTGLCYPPMQKSFNLARVPASAQSSTTLAAQTANAPENSTSTYSASIDADKSTNGITASESNALNTDSSDTNEAYTILKRRSTVIAMLSFFGFGFLLSLTPCMFPMYPIWSAIILGKKEKNLRSTATYSFWYSQGLALTYMIAGFVIASAGARFHATMQQPWVLGAISLLFIALALSCFGFFSFGLPGIMQNKLHNLSDKLKGGSRIGVFLMGALSAIIASPCTTAPLAGALLFIAQDGNILMGGLSLYIMALGMSVPLFIIAFAGHKFLPKSGNWMETVKVLCGFLMLTVPLILLENCLSAIVINISWIILVGAIVAYLVYRFIPLHTNENGKLRPHISQIILWGITGISCLILCIQFGLSQLSSIKHFEEIKNTKELSTVLAKPHDAKFILVDFKASWCRECMHMDQTTFKDPMVKKALAQGRNYQVDVTEPDSPAQQILLQYGLKGVPAIIIFKDGLPPTILSGYTSSEELLKHL